MSRRYRYPAENFDGIKKPLHIFVAEKALGRALPVGAVVHHFNEDTMNYSNKNLVICEDRAYHNLLHVRQRALAACGNPEYRKCSVCKQWDSQANLRIIPRSEKGVEIYHRRCFKVRDRKYR